MNVKISSIVGIPALCLTANAQQVPVFYQFSINSGYVLEDAYFINTEPQEAYGFVTPLEINGQTTFPSGTYQSDFADGTTFGANCVTLIGVVTATNSGATTVGVTMPLWLANNLVLSNGVWTNYTAELRPYGSLPDAQTTVSNLQTSSDFFLQDAYGYLPTNSPVLQAYGQVGAVVSLDGAQIIGAFSFSLGPILTVSAVEGSVTIQWPTNATGFTLAQTADLAAASWMTVTNSPTATNGDFSVTLPLGAMNSFFRLQK